MPTFSASSLAKLATCDPRLQALFAEVVLHVDCTILCGERGEAEQNAEFDAGRSKLRYPHSRHNSRPSRAVDVAPYPIDWRNQRRFDHFAGVVRGIALAMGIKLRWGGDFNRNYNPADESFLDLVHFEIDGD
jgi:hypothetical protein